MSVRKAGMIEVVLLLLGLMIVYCAAPLDPSDPGNTKITPLVKNRYNVIEEKIGSDSLGNTVSVGAELHLPENFDSVYLIITVEGEAVFDTMFRDFNRLAKNDTIWKAYFFDTEGNKTAIFTPFSKEALSPVTANVFISPNPKYNENHPPVLRVTGSTINRLMETVKLEITAVDADSGQTALVTMTKGPENAGYLNNLFTWTPPANFAGTETVQFIASDDGSPGMFDTVDISLVVTATPSQPALIIGGRRIVKPAEICTLTLSVSDEDEGQQHTVEMSGNPENTLIEGDSLFIWGIPADAMDGEYPVTFTVTDNGIPPLSRSSEVILTVSAAGITRNIPPMWYADTLPAVVNEESYSLELAALCSDANGDELQYSLLPGNPENDAIINGEYICIVAEGSEGKHFVNIVATDTEDARDTLVISMEVTNYTGGIVGPAITAVPGDTTVSAGVALQFTVEFTGTTPKVQWRKDGTAIDGAVGATLSFASVTASDAGSYTVKVWNEKDSAVSNAFVLSVISETKPVFSVTYDGNGNSAGEVPLDETEYESGMTVTIKENSGNLGKAGFSFTGWNTNADGSGTNYTPSSTLEMGTENVTLFAQWSNNPTFTVTYNGNDNSGGAVPIDVTNYENGMEVTVKSNSGNLSKTGFNFIGWNTAPDGTGTDYSPTATFTMGSEDVMFFAQWSSNPTFTVTYDGNDNSGGEVPIDETHYEAGTTVTVKNNSGNLIRTGFSFIGWNTAADGSGTNHAPSSMLTMASADVTLFAQWSVNPTFTITYDGNGKSGGDVPVDETEYETGTKVTIKSNAGNLTKTGSTFTGWNTAADGTGTTYTASSTLTMGTADITLFAKWSTNPTYTVTYNGNGNSSGSVPADETGYESGTTVTVKSNTGNLTKLGSAFTGWNTAADGTGTAYATSGSLIMGESDVTLYAQWVIDMFTVAFNSLGGSPVPSQNYSHGARVVKPADPTRSGYEFEGWFKEEAGTNEWNFTTETVSRNTTIYAKWTRIVRVTYNDNGATSGNVPVDNNTYRTGEYATILAKPASLVKNESTFSGWCEDSEGSGTVYQGGTSIEIGSDDIVLFALWKAVPCTVSYDRGFDAVEANENGPSVTMESVPKGGTIGQVPVGEKKGYVFAGWWTGPNGTGSEFISYSLVSQNITVYAKWNIEDADGNRYTQVAIGDKVWMGENLKVTDGLTFHIFATDWSTRTDPSYTWYVNNAANKDPHGAYYNAAAVTSGTMIPDGWHIPTESEWENLQSYAEMNYTRGDLALLTGDWTIFGTIYTYSNESGLTLYPSGLSNENADENAIGFSGSWWTSTPGVLFSYIPAAGGFGIRQSNAGGAYNVRLIRDY